MKFIYLIVILIINIQVVFSTQHQHQQHEDEESGRLFWDALGTWIDDSEWFPIEINIPDVIQGIGQGIGSMYNYVSSWASMAGTGSSSAVVSADTQQIPEDSTAVVNEDIPKIKSVKKKIKKNKKKNKQDSLWSF